MGRIVKENGKVWDVVEHCGGLHTTRTLIGTYEEKEEKAVEEDENEQPKPKRARGKRKEAEGD